MSDAEQTLARKIDAARELLDAAAMAPDAITAAQALRMLAETAESALRQAVPLSRESGASWADLGAVLGCTRQAAQQRYGAI
jgi:hypothetical protein